MEGINRCGFDAATALEGRALAKGCRVEDFEERLKEGYMHYGRAGAEAKAKVKDDFYKKWDWHL